MDIGKSISFVFEDEHWLQKVLIGGLIVLATIIFSWTIIGLFVGIGLLLGYSLDLLKNVRRGNPRPLPEWDDWGDKTVKGIKLMLVFLVWAIPLIIVAIPTSLLGSFSENNDAGILIGLFITCLSCLMVLYALLLSILSPAIIIKFAEEERFADGFAFSKIFSFTRDNIGDIIIAVLVLWAVQIVAGIVGSILCLIGLLFTSFWTNLVQFHLFGQIGLDLADVDGGESTPFDLSPEDVMPGVGEIGEKVNEGAENAVVEVQDLGDSVRESTTDALDDVVDQTDEHFEELP